VQSQLHLLCLTPSPCAGVDSPLWCREVAHGCSSSVAFGMVWADPAVGSVLGAIGLIKVCRMLLGAAGCSGVCYRFRETTGSRSALHPKHLLITSCTPRLSACSHTFTLHSPTLHHVRGAPHASKAHEVTGLQSHARRVF